MNAQTQTRSIQTQSGRIEVLIDQALKPRGLALIAHPHPLFGGSNQNKVVQTLARAFLEQGYDTWRPNSRGVGASEGVFDEGRGETEDFLDLLQVAQSHYPGLGSAQQSLALAGFSFGAFVTSHALARLSPANKLEKLVLVGTAASRFQVAPVPTELHNKTLVLHGEVDDT
ncbi:MAG: alpha/beta hydrolase, partial [Betaproteobacteria bacterium]|nr:alpha/beta hydrolase [Betaproteobacteria bacterium]